MNDQAFAEVVGRQYMAGLSMIHNAIDKCPDDLWQQRCGREAPFWQHALHVLFFTRLYLFDSLASAAAAGNGKHVMELLGAPLKDSSEAELERMSETVGYTGLTEASFSTPRTPTRAELLNFIELTRTTCRQAMVQISAPGGADVCNPMPWMRGTRGDLLIYNLRHLHMHLGRLHSMLGRAGIRVDWIGGLPQA